VVRLRWSRLRDPAASGRLSTGQACWRRAFDTTRWSPLWAQAIQLMSPSARTARSRIDQPAAWSRAWHASIVSAAAALMARPDPTDSWECRPGNDPPVDSRTPLGGSSTAGHRSHRRQPRPWNAFGRPIHAAFADFARGHAWSATIPATRSSAPRSGGLTATRRRARFQGLATSCTSRSSSVSGCF